MSRRHVLIIEDSIDISEPITTLLESEGYTVSCAENGQEGLKYLHTTDHVPQIILLDLMMPLMDGSEFRNRQKNDPKISQIPIILMSASAIIEKDAIRLGVNAFLPKPLDIDQLLDTVESIIKGE